MKLPSRTRTFLLSAAILFAAGTLADDIEIYYGNVQQNEDTPKPNILLTLDNNVSVDDQQMKEALKQVLDSVHGVNVGLFLPHNMGGSILYPVKNIDASVSNDLREIIVEIGDPNDDARQPGNANTANVDETSGADHVLILREFKSATQASYTGLRFRNVRIPQGIKIESAYLEFQNNNSSSTESSTVKLKISGQASDDVANPFSNTEDISPDSRTRTTPKKDWEITQPWLGTSVADTLCTTTPCYRTYVSPDIKEVVQAIVDRPGWCGGNSMALFADGDEGSGSLDSRTAESFEQVYTETVDGVTRTFRRPARLRIVYDAGEMANGATGCNVTDTSATVTDNRDDAWQCEAGSGCKIGDVASVGGNNPNDKVIKLGYSVANPDKTHYTLGGFRFRNMQIPTNAVIKSAELQMTVKTQYNTGDTLNLKGEIATDADGADAFSGTSNNISTRILPPRTPATCVTDWSGVPNLAAGEVLSTNSGTGGASCLRSIVQSIVNSANSWQPGKALAIIVDAPNTGSAARREVWAYEGDVGKVARLNVTYQYNHSPSGGQTVRDELKAAIDNTTLTPASHRHRADILHEAARYYYGKQVLFGKTRGAPLGVMGAGTTICASDYTGQCVTPDSGMNNAADARYGRLSTDKALKADKQGTLVQPAGCTDATINTDACRGEYRDRLSDSSSGTYPEYQKPDTNKCVPNIFVLVSNQNPTPQNSPLAPGYIDSMTTPTPTQCGSEPSDTCTSFASCSTDIEQCIGRIAQYMRWGNTDIPIITHTVLVSPNYTGAAKDQLVQAHTHGGGNGYHAATPEDLKVALTTIFNSVLSVPTSFVAPALSVNAFNRLFNRNEVYFALFKPKDTAAWPGNVKKYLICDQAQGCASGTALLGDVLDANGAQAIIQNQEDPDAGKIDPDARSLWSESTDGRTIEEGGAGAEIPGYATRNVYTYTSTSTDNSANFPPTAVALNGNTHLLKDENTAITAALLGWDGATAAERTKLINWIRGQDVDDEDEDGVTNEDRAWRFADPLHSRPLVLTYGGNSSNPVQKVVVGTNDGALHFLNASGTEASPNPANGGVEQWEFYAPASLDEQKKLYDNDTASASQKIYGMDGSPSAFIKDNDADGIIEPSEGDFVRVFAGMRRGGSDIYALDVTPASTLTNPALTNDITPKLLWRIEGGTNKAPTGCTGYECKKYDYTGLGETWSTPRPTKIRVTTTTACPGGVTECVTSKDVLILGGGFSDPNNEDKMAITEYSDDGWPDKRIAKAQTTSGGNGVYVVEAATGKRILWISNTTSTADLKLPYMDYPVPGDVKTVDSDGDGFTDRLYFADIAGQVWRVDLGVSESASGPGPGTTAGGRLAVLSDYVNDNGTIKVKDTDPIDSLHKRRFYFGPEVTPVRDAFFTAATTAGNAVTDYDIVTISSGYSGHPLDTSVHDRVYAIRDFMISDLQVEATGSTTLANNPKTITIDGSGNPTNYPLCLKNTGSISFCGGPLTEGNLYDTTENLIQNGPNPEDAAQDEVAVLQVSEGWYIKFDAAAFENGVFSDGAEKGLSPTTVSNGILFFSTYLPASDAVPEDSCVGAEGAGRLWAVDLLWGAAVFEDFFDDGGLTTADRFLQSGSGIPTRPSLITHVPGITILVGGSAGATNPGVVLPYNVQRTYWYQN